ncbi:MAG TPA: DinB family protein [Gemmatimonadaceae bacterium]|nr:DinB family protein [Gemmatimonadaceae bacterium]
MSVAEIFLARSRYWLTKEYPIKLRHCVDALPREAVWARPNPSSNSIGNLLVHLTGNVSEWILGGVGGRRITRNRAAEFAQQEGADAKTLLDGLEAVLREVDSVLAGLTETDLQRELVIQDRKTTVLAAIYHVVEHFAMHSGQIILLTKLHAPGKIHFYEDAGGLARPTWHLGTILDEAPH